MKIFSKKCIILFAYLAPPAIFEMSSFSLGLRVFVNLKSKIMKKGLKFLFASLFIIMMAMLYFSPKAISQNQWGDDRWCLL